MSPERLFFSIMFPLYSLLISPSLLKEARRISYRYLMLLVHLLDPGK